MVLKEIIRDIEVLRTEGPLDKDIDAVYYDSRQVTPGSLFFCIKGLEFDGHDFAGMAVDNGASAVVLNRDVVLPRGISKIFVENPRHAMGLAASNFYGNPTKKLLLFGVTGTNGKTTTSYLIKSILDREGKKSGLIGTITNIVGGRTIPSVRTTPESVELQRMLGEMVNEKTDIAVMEVSSHSLELDKVAGCRFEVGIFTNLTQDHLDFHGTLENYRRAKSKLFRQSRISVINVDDANGRIILNEAQGKICTYGIQRNADVYARELEITTKGISFKLYTPDDSVDINLKMPGIFSVYNALAAASACYAAGILPDSIKTGLEAIRGVPGRFELLDTETDYSVFIDYAHTPDGLENVLKTARELTRGRLITLFGCGGDRDPAKREVMGEAAGKYSDLCIITSDNPRTEKPMDIIQQILPGLDRTGCQYEVVENRRDAIALALKLGQKGDVIILAGKGHETYQILKDKTIHFDEKEVVAELLGREKV